MQDEIRAEIAKFGQELVGALNLQSKDASAQGDRQGALVIQRISNAVSRVFERRDEAAAAKGE